MKKVKDCMIKMNDKIKKELKESGNLKYRISESMVDEIRKITEIIIKTYNKNKKLVVFGCGGSAADAQHIVGEFMNKFKLERNALPAIALTTNTSTITAIGNDYDFSRVFEIQVTGLVNENDVVIGISTSGNSEAVRKGLIKAKKMGAITVALTGETGGKLNGLTDYILKIPSKETPRIQECHITIAHIICGLVEESLFGKKIMK